MNEARNPLVREIEEAAQIVRTARDSSVYVPAVWQRMIDLWRLSLEPEWPRIRAVLEAAEDLADAAESEHSSGFAEFDQFDPECPECQLLGRYRAAARRPQ